MEFARVHPERLATLTTFGTTAQLTSSPALVRTMTALLRLLGPSGTGRLANLERPQEFDAALRSFLERYR